MSAFSPNTWKIHGRFTLSGWRRPLGGNLQHLQRWCHVLLNELHLFNAILIDFPIVIQSQASLMNCVQGDVRKDWPYTAINQAKRWLPPSPPHTGEIRDQAGESSGAPEHLGNVPSSAVIMWWERSASGRNEIISLLIFQLAPLQKHNVDGWAYHCISNKTREG